MKQQVEPNVLQRKANMQRRLDIDLPNRSNTRELKLKNRNLKEETMNRIFS